MKKDLKSSPRDNQILLSLSRLSVSGSLAFSPYITFFLFSSGGISAILQSEAKKRITAKKEESTVKQWTKEERYRVLKSAEEIRELHERTILSDYRQHYHIQSVTGLLNDPNGFVFHDGL